MALETSSAVGTSCVGPVVAEARGSSSAAKPNSPADNAVAASLNSVKAPVKEPSASVTASEKLVGTEVLTEMPLMRKPTASCHQFLRLAIGDAWPFVATDGAS
jgi:hypothetical protein